MPKKRCVVVICDSLRNDLLGPSTPTLTILEQSGTRALQARAVFPSTTRVSAASVATGCYPEQHGLLGNTMILPEAEGLVARSVGKPEFREQLHAATGAYLRVPTLAQRLKARGTTAIYSNVSPGAAYFFDPECHGYVFHRAGSYAPGGKALSGDQGLEISSGAAGDAHMTSRFSEHLLADEHLVLGVLWLSEPDASGHAVPLGSARHQQAIRSADTCVAQVLETVSQLRERGEDVLLMVGSDHGMVTITNQVNIGHALVEAGFKAAPYSRDIVVAPNGTAAVLGFNDDYPHRETLLTWLAQQPWVGEMAAGGELADWGMPDSPSSRIAISMAGDDARNAEGLPGTAWYAVDPSEDKDYIGQGQHGGRHLRERHSFLIIQGGDFAPSAQITQTVSLVDYAPTILRHLNLPAEGMQGRPLQLAALAQAGV